MTGWISLQSKGLSRVFSNTTVQKHQFFGAQLSALQVVLFAYLRLLIYLLANLIPASASSNPGFLMMYSAYKLNKQGDNIQPWRTPFLIWNQSAVPCPTLTVASRPTYRFLRRLKFAFTNYMILMLKHWGKNWMTIYSIHNQIKMYKANVSQNNLSKLTFNDLKSRGSF